MGELAHDEFDMVCQWEYLIGCRRGPIREEHTIQTGKLLYGDEYDMPCWWEQLAVKAFQPACNPLIGLICCHRRPPFMFQISLQHTSPFLTFAEKFTERHIWRQTQREGIDIKKTEKMFLFVTLTNYFEEKKNFDQRQCHFSHSGSQLQYHYDAIACNVSFAVESTYRYCRSASAR